MQTYGILRRKSSGSPYHQFPSRPLRKVNSIRLCTSQIFGDAASRRQTKLFGQYCSKFIIPFDRITSLCGGGLKFVAYHRWEGSKRRTWIANGVKSREIETVSNNDAVTAPPANGLTIRDSKANRRGCRTLRNKFYDGFHPRVSSPNLSDGEILLCSLRSTVHGDIWELIPSQSGQGPFGKGSQAGTPI
ncbi:hypothetical protein CC2G_006688 [Coprinopsis cinerea AmutBmut pab1-1]|nr:hypothetical protein CC2G_006688 [Coprinopsis cinerea AmutBmut pab1-1]